MEGGEKKMKLKAGERRNEISNLAYLTNPDGTIQLHCLTHTGTKWTRRTKSGSNGYRIPIPSSIIPRQVQAS